MPDPTPTFEVSDRQRWMAVLARAAADDLSVRLQACGALPGWRRLRGPDTGLVMVRGRIGGGGAPFNLGEMTVTRCTVRSECGFTGHAYVAGRDDRRAELAAAADAMLQDPELRTLLESNVITPLGAQQNERRSALAARAAATRVQFFAMQKMR